MVIFSGSVSHNRVEPSTSPSSNVTVPVGSNSPTLKSLQVSCGISACWLMVASIAADTRQNIRQNAQIASGRAARSTRPTAQIYALLRMVLIAASRIVGA